MAKKGLIFDIQRQCIHDGDGVRTVLFVKGCPLRCKWCANPESQSMEQEIAVLPQRCIGDGNCIQACPNAAIKRPAQIDRSKCIRCGKCTEVCYPGALSVFGRWIDSDAVSEKLLKDKPFFSRGGGITISGGEPFGQAEFVKDILYRLHAEGIHTAVETCGYARAEDLLAAKVDQFLFDIKLMDEEKHLYWVGASNRLILKNLKLLSEAGRRITLRMPMIPGVNDDEDNIREVVDLMHRLNICEFHILPFHQLGMSKYQMIDKAYALKEKLTPTTQEVRRIVELFQRSGVQPIVGG